MSIYQSILLSGWNYWKQLQSAYQNYKNWHYKRQLANKIKNTELPKAEVKNRQELYLARKANRFYRISY